MTLKSGFALLKETFSAWVDDYAPSMGAALAYYTMFSIAPVLLIVIAVAGFIFEQDAVRGEVVLQLRGLMGEDGAHVIEGLLASVGKPATSALATVFGFAALIFGGELQDALDRIWRAPARNKQWNLGAPQSAAAVLRHDIRHSFPINGFLSSLRRPFCAR
jgi:membrane protein